MQNIFYACSCNVMKGIIIIYSLINDRLLACGREWEWKNGDGNKIAGMGGNENNN